MKAITQEQQTNIFNFLNGLNTVVTITDYVNIENIDFKNPFDSIYDTLNDNGGLDIEIIYYGSAMEYLTKNDPSLRESLEIATEYGYTTEKLNSELLASLLASRNAQEEIYELREEIETFFAELVEQLEEQE